ncbi:hypothetical protein CLU81_0488 [Flavobacterium sp. 9]|uniref:hypothetical protein n=1 Tax=Flavobacterium sp. 9 TaxID=2035198 RepID=UPI000C1839F2|nr:hypothetical protein [Flavobacterium sp. 9]PIF30091.1 hypothetical protein CLU81_0488 [Flavobacterium sp. 9]
MLTNNPTRRNSKKTRVAERNPSYSNHLVSIYHYYKYEPLIDLITGVDINMILRKQEVVKAIIDPSTLQKIAFNNR